MAARRLMAALVIAWVGLVTVPAPVHAAPSAAAQITHPCTRTSSGTCIQGGQFCPQDKYGESGWDAQGRRYVCRGDHTHPHWMKPRRH